MLILVKMRRTKTGPNIGGSKVAKRTESSRIIIYPPNVNSSPKDFGDAWSSLIRKKGYEYL